MQKLAEGVEAALNLDEGTKHPEVGASGHEDGSATSREVPSPDGGEQGAAPRPPDTWEKPAVAERAVPESSPIKASEEPKGTTTRGPSSTEQKEEPPPPDTDAVKGGSKGEPESSDLAPH
ncbi:hypothetical protein G6O67_005337 [Ophiocordyceps sinensis]|nr:hypothetical protein G6O67_005337 [Ophiocordyceps sinensis]